MRWLIRVPLILLALLFAAWMGITVWALDLAGPGTPFWAVSGYVADQVVGSVVCAVTGCPAELPEGMSLRVFAEQKLLPATPVALDVDEHGRVWVAESGRHGGHGVEDNRAHMYWLADDLAAKTVADRRAFYEKWVAAGKFERLDHFTSHADGISTIEDTDGDGSADTRHEVLRFQDWEDGIAAGILVRGREAWYTAIPDMGVLRDADGDGAHEQNEVFATGFGVRNSLPGHDLHGLVFGPDGKLYFSMGDRGYNVTTREGVQLEPLIDHGRGAVFRVNPDGSNLEVFATGLRNPQELAFDDTGNLFTGDNNGDGGDRARIVYVVEGGETGWAMPYQTQIGDYLRGQWNAEKLWELQHERQPAWVLPPIAHLTNGPSGLAHYPGLGLPERYRGHFFLCDYGYQSGRSGAWSFALKPKGAGFEMTDSHHFAWSLLLTDITFGWDLRLYANRYDQYGKEQSLVVMEHAASRADPRVAEVEKLARAGVEQQADELLEQLLASADQRIRQRAQFELARRGAAPRFARVLNDTASPPLVRIHALWGLAQLGAEALRAAGVSDFAFAASDDELRAQAARVAGDAHALHLTPGLLALLGDASPRVRFFAAQSLGALGAKDAVAPLVALLRENANRDVFLRHAAVRALERIGDRDAVLAAVRDDSPAVRLAALLVLRRWRDAEVVRFLQDPDPLLVVEAARAIHDVPIAEGLPALAALATQGMPALPADDAQTSWALTRRVIQANLIQGDAAAASALAALAADKRLALPMRRMALAALGDFPKPQPRDLAIGAWRPLPERDATLTHAALREHGPALVKGELADEALEIATKLGFVPLPDDELLANARGSFVGLALRVASLRALAARLPDSAEHLDIALTSALASRHALLRAEARDLLAEQRPADAYAQLAAVVDRAPLVERQRAYAALGRLADARAEALLARALEQLAPGALHAGVQLDVLEAARARGSAPLAASIAAWEATPGDVVAQRTWALAGGDAKRGELVFQGAGDCQRCHGEVEHGGRVGPDLAGIVGRRGAGHVIRSIFDPQAEIATGYATISLTRTDGSVVSGTLLEEANGELVVEQGRERVRIPLAQIASRQGPVSGMPPMGFALVPRDLRDLIAYLATL